MLPRVLSVNDHSRDAAGMTYVYPVVSRRAGGVSVGINLNPNAACNWRCVYCQVPGLHFGKGPPIDLSQLERELGEMLEVIVHGDYLQRAAPEGARQLVDVAFSGNGEPTSSPDFARSVEVVGRVLERFGLLGTIPVVLITNGSLAHRADVQAALGRMAELGGRVWLKLDSATAEGARRINSSPLPPAEHLAKLRAAAERCPTWIQTCLFAWGGEAPSETEQQAYLDAVRELVNREVPVRGVLLYTLARPSLQPEASELSALPREWLEAFAQRIREAGLEVRVSA